jgi:ankyrin repeat protein
VALEERATPLCYTSLFSFSRMAKLLLTRGTDVSAQGGYYGNALYAASLRGHEQVVKLLLEEALTLICRVEST